MVEKPEKTGNTENTWFSLKLDSRDYRLLYELDVDCRQSLTQLAAKLGVSKQRAAYRLARLEAAGVVKGYSTLIDPSRLGFLQFRTYVRLRRADEAVLSKIIDFLKAQNRVWGIVRMSGPADVVFATGVRKPSEYHAFWDSVEREFKPWIASARVSVYSPVYHFSKAYLVGAREEGKVRIIGGEPVEVDETDLKVLEAISQNARASAVEIAGRAGADPQTVVNRLRKLEANGVIQGYRALIDVERLGFEFYKVDFSLASTVDKEKIRDYCRVEPNAYQVNDTIGGADLEVEFHVRNLRELLAKIEGLRKAFPGVIECFEYYRLLSEEKMTFFPE